MKPRAHCETVRRGSPTCAHSVPLCARPTPEDADARNGSSRLLGRLSDRSRRGLLRNGRRRGPQSPRRHTEAHRTARRRRRICVPETRTPKRPVVALARPKVHRRQRRDRRRRRPRKRIVRRRGHADTAPAEFGRSTMWSHSFATRRFHVLLNSLFKVLFNFPSRYLFAIGLATVFSLRWSLPPTLGCTLKQPDSEDGCERRPGPHRMGLTPALGDGLGRENSDAVDRRRAAPSYTPQLPPRHSGHGGFSAGHFPLHSPLLGESSLVSFPPLTNMLKFSG